MTSIVSAASTVAAIFTREDEIEILGFFEGVSEAVEITPEGDGAAVKEGNEAGAAGASSLSSESTMRLRRMGIAAFDDDERSPLSVRTAWAVTFLVADSDGKAELK